MWTCRWRVLPLTERCDALVYGVNGVFGGRRTPRDVADWCWRTSRDVTWCTYHVIREIKQNQTQAFFVLLLCISVTSRTRILRFATRLTWQRCLLRVPCIQTQV